MHRVSHSIKGGSPQKSTGWVTPIEWLTQENIEWGHSLKVVSAKKNTG